MKGTLLEQISQNYAYIREQEEIVKDTLQMKKQVNFSKRKKKLQKFMIINKGNS